MEINNEVGNDQDQEFGQMVERRLNAENFAAPANNTAVISDERLSAMSKKLPEWSLEPPYSFLK